MWSNFVMGCILIIISFSLGMTSLDFMSQKYIGVEIFWVAMFILFASGIYLVSCPFRDFYRTKDERWVGHFVFGSMLIIVSVIIGFVPSFILAGPDVYYVNPLPYWALSFSILAAGFYVIIKPFIIIKKGKTCSIFS